MGASVVLVSRNAETAERAVAELPAGNHHAAVAEVSDTASLTRLTNDVQRKYGRIDMLVNSAGFTKAIPHANLDALDDALIDQMFAPSTGAASSPRSASWRRTRSHGGRAGGQRGIDRRAHRAWAAMSRTAR
ncbi:SDR family NAD(P)-dependent oxidoreductase [Cupriavidus basilensis]